MIADLTPYLIGWRGYFGFCQTPRVLTNLEAWIRRRLRLYLWRQWRNGHNRFTELRRFGIAKFAASVAAGSPTGLLAHVRTPGGSTRPTKSRLRLSWSPPNLHACAGLTRSNRRGTDPYARWCGRGGVARRPPIPINGTKRTFAKTSTSASVLTLNCPVITHAASTLSRAARARLIFSRIAAPSAFQV